METTTRYHRTRDGEAIECPTCIGSGGLDEETSCRSCKGSGIQVCLGCVDADATVELDGVPMCRACEVEAASDGIAVTKEAPVLSDAALLAEWARATESARPPVRAADFSDSWDDGEPTVMEVR